MQLSMYGRKAELIGDVFHRKPIKLDFLVTKRQDPTRSHLEHGRKDCLRRNYLAEDRLGR